MLEKISINNFTPSDIISAIYMNKNNIANKISRIVVEQQVTIEYNIKNSNW